VKPEQTGGIILRTRPLTETSLIVHWLTPEFGRMATVAKGARRAKSPFRGKLDLSEADFSFVAAAGPSAHFDGGCAARDARAIRRTSGGCNKLLTRCRCSSSHETETPVLRVPVAHGIRAVRGDGVSEPAQVAAFG
jgi:hypothetical protein